LYPSDTSPLVHFASIGLLAAILITGFYRYTLPANTNTSDVKPKLFVKPDKSVLLLGLIAFSCMICEGSMADWTGVYFQNIIHAPAKFITIGYVAFMATMATGRFLGDWLITKFGVSKILQFSGLLIASGLAIMIIFPHFQAAVTGCLLLE
jgi:fucose permease